MKNAAPRARRSHLGPPLDQSFYNRETEIVARELLGAVLECRTPEGVASGRIVETEAYLGEHDLACHAAVGKTERTAPLYGPPGIAYVYFIYGMYWCFNAVTRAEHDPAAVLIRALEPLDGIDLMWRRRSKVKRAIDLANGPGKLCLALGITGEMTWKPLQRPPILIRSSDAIADRDVVVTPRVGITQWAEAPLRYFIRDNPFVSKTPSTFPRTAYRTKKSRL